MKKALPVLFGVLLPLALFLYLLQEEDPEASHIEDPKILGVEVSYGDSNVKEISYPPLYAKQFEDLVRSKKGNFSIFIKDLSSGQTINVGKDNEFYAASLYKISLAISLLQKVQNGAFDLDKTLTYEEGHYHTGSGALKNEEFGGKYSVEEVLRRLIKDSDNVAQSMLLGEIGGMGAYEIMPNPKTLKASQISLILEKLYFGEYLDEVHTGILLRTMEKTSFDNRIHSGLVKGMSFSHKIGNWARTGSWHDCGILTRPGNPVIVCVMSKNTTYLDFLSVTEGVGKLLSKVLVD